MSLTQKVIDLAEAGMLPDFLVRAGIRNLCRKSLRQCGDGNCEKAADMVEEYLRKADSSPVAILPEKANEQHYEVPPGFYELTLGPRLKYSCSFWPDPATDLEEAERLALETTCRRSGLEDGQAILELGCGWGSLSLWMAQQYPQSRITSLSNSHSQKAFIEEKAEEKGLKNLKMVTGDVNEFAPEGTFDRVVSVEMFEHVRYHRELFRRIESWLKPEGRLFTHVFCHRSMPYPFRAEEEDDWMSRHFFSGGTMPSDDLFLRISGSLELERQNRWSGIHYARTSEAWLQNLDRNKSGVLKIFSEELTEAETRKTFHRWRLFFMACAETFGFDNGQEWWVSHYLFRKK